MKLRMRRIYEVLHFYVIKLPFVYITVPLGFIFEFLITFPFIILVGIDSRKMRRLRHSAEDKVSAGIGFNSDSSDG